MDFQHRPGGKTGTGGVASWSDANRDRRERLRQLAMETIDLNKDPYFMKNHLGGYECKLCLTLHNNEGSYLAHTQGKKHQSNLARRAAQDARDQPAGAPALDKPRVEPKKFVKIGRPGYKVTKQREPNFGQQSLLFQIDYPEIGEGLVPRHRFMSAYEQKIEPPDKRWQYLLFAAEPYETISFKIPSREVDKSETKFWTLWNKDTKQFFLQFAFRSDVRDNRLALGGAPGGHEAAPPPPPLPIVRAPPPNLAPPNLAQQNLAPQNLAQQNLAPQNLTQQNLAPQNLAPPPPPSAPPMSMLPPPPPPIPVPPPPIGVPPPPTTTTTTTIS